MSTVTTQHTLEELARTVNRIIVERPGERNPTSDSDTSCLYHSPNTGQRCLIGQALFEMTGLSVPGKYEGQSIDVLLTDMEFCNFFGLPADSRFRDETLWLTVGGKQAQADQGKPWGSLSPIDIDAAR